MKDEDVHGSVVDQLASGEAGSISEAIEQVAALTGLSVAITKDAYQRHIDSKAPVEAPKPLRDGTEGDSIASAVKSLEVLVDDAEQHADYLRSVIRQLKNVEVRQAGTEKMSRLADILKLDR